LEIQRTLKETLTFEFIGKGNDPFKSQMTAEIEQHAKNNRNIKHEVFQTQNLTTWNSHLVTLMRKPQKVAVKCEIDAFKTMGFLIINFFGRLLKKFFILKKKLRKLNTED